MKFKRLDSGSYAETPYCINPDCHNAPMSYLPKMFHGIAVCETCGRKVQIAPHDFKKLLEQLNSDIA